MISRRRAGPSSSRRSRMSGRTGTDPARIAYYDWMLQLTTTLNSGTVWIMCSGGRPRSHHFHCNGGGGCSDIVPNQNSVQHSRHVGRRTGWRGSSRGVALLLH